MSWYGRGILTALTSGSAVLFVEAAMALGKLLGGWA